MMESLLFTGIDIDKWGSIGAKRRSTAAELFVQKLSTARCLHSADTIAQPTTVYDSREVYVNRIATVSIRVSGPTMSTKPLSKPSKAVQKRTQRIPEAEAEALARHEESAIQTYGRGDRIHTRSIKDKKLKSNLKSLENKYKAAALGMNSLPAGFEDFMKTDSNTQPPKMPKFSSIIILVYSKPKILWKKHSRSDKMRLHRALGLRWPRKGLS